MKLLRFDPTKPDAERKAAALEVIDALRDAVDSGRLVAFVGVGIQADDTTDAWACATRPVTRLRVMGAIASLQHGYHADTDDWTST